MPWANAAVPAAGQGVPRQPAAGGRPGRRAGAAAAPATTRQPVLPPDVNQFYLPLAGRRSRARRGVPAVRARLRRGGLRRGQAQGPGAHRRPVRLLAAAGRGRATRGLGPGGARSATPWTARPPRPAPLGQRARDARHRPQAQGAGEGVRRHLYSTQKLSLFENRALELVSEPGESEEAFRERCRQAAEERRTPGAGDGEGQVRPKFEALDADLPADDSAARRPAGVGWLVRLVRARAPRRRRGRRREGAQADGRLPGQGAEIIEKWKRIGEEATAIQVKPRKADVRVTHFGLAWAPWQAAGSVPLWK